MSCQSCSGWESGYCKRYGLKKLPLEYCDTWDTSISILVDNTMPREINSRKKSKHTYSIESNKNDSFIKSRRKQKTYY
jgi:hypothetical protein